jgi:hypothetical protein
MREKWGGPFLILKINPYFRLIFVANQYKTYIQYDKSAGKKKKNGRSVVKIVKAL